MDERKGEGEASRYECEMRLQCCLKENKDATRVLSTDLTSHNWAIASPLPKFSSRKIKGIVRPIESAGRRTHRRTEARNAPLIELKLGLRSTVAHVASDLPWFERH
jgi:hypothetical protein